MEKKVYERIRQLLEKRRISAHELAKILGVNPQSVYNYLAGTSKAPLSFVLAILESFPDVSAEWMLRGEGEMTKPSPHSHYLEMAAKINGAEQNAIMDAIRSLDERLSAIEKSMKK